MQYVKTNWLDAVTENGATEPEQVHGANRYGLHLVTTGSPTSGEVTLQGSLDGSSWFSVFGIQLTYSTQMRWNDTSTNTSGDPLPDNRLEGPVTFLRLNLTGLSGGTSPTVTASVIATD